MTDLITPALLETAGAVPGNAALYAPHLAAACAKRDITAWCDIANLLAEVMNESGDLASVHECMTYTTAARIVAVFPSHFPGGVRQALPFVRQPKLLGDRVYAALGGYDARGDGLAEVTGLTNFRAYAADIGRPESAVEAYMTTPEGAADSAAWYFVRFGCRGLADPTAVRCRWAGTPPGRSPIGLANVLRLFAIFARALGVSHAAAVPSADAASADSTDALNEQSAAGTLDIDGA